MTILTHLINKRSLSSIPEDTWIIILTLLDYKSSKYVLDILLCLKIPRDICFIKKNYLYKILSRQEINKHMLDIYNNINNITTYIQYSNYHLKIYNSVDSMIFNRYNYELLNIKTQIDSNTYKLHIVITLATILKNSLLEILETKKHKQMLSNLTQFVNRKYYWNGKDADYTLYQDVVENYIDLCKRYKE